MAHVTKSYLLEYASITTSGNVVMECVDAFYVEGLADGASATYSAVIATGLPGVWTPHPVIPNLNAISYSPSFKGTEAAIVAVRYVNVQPQIILRGGVGLVAAEADEDRNKVPIVLSNQSTTSSPPVTSDARKVQGGVIKYLRPQATLCVERVLAHISFFGGVDPAAVASDYTGKLNDSTFLGAPENTVLCENIGFDNVGFAGVAWRMTFEFRIDLDGWQPRVAYVDPKTGQPGPFLTKASGYDSGTVSTADDPQYGRKIIDRFPQTDLNYLIT